MAVDLDALIRAVRSNPEARDTLRRELLTEEVLELPALVAKLVKAQERTEERLSEVKTIAERADGRVSNLVGADYERHEAVRAVWSIEAAVGLTPGTLRPVTTDELRPQLAAAVAAKTLAPEAADGITKVNGLFAWGADPGHVSGYVVVEASLTADHKDVERALARAADLGRVTGVVTRAVVVSDQVAKDAAEAISQRRVAYARVPPRRLGFHIP